MNTSALVMSTDMLRRLTNRRFIIIIFIICEALASSNITSLDAGQRRSAQELNVFCGCLGSVVVRASDS